MGLSCFSRNETDHLILVVGLTRFRGHFPKGGYDGGHGTRQEGSTGAAATHEAFRAGAVRLVLDEGKTVGRVAGDLDLTASALRAWVARAGRP
jgi:hypothetical protein